MGIYDRLPLPLSERLSSATSALYTRQGREVDVAIGGIPFMLATFSELPQSVETVPMRKDQFDTEADPGEQTLTGWWRRSQSSWHEGAGNLYQESSEQNVANNGFWDSSGVDIFTQGQMTLLKAMKTAAQAAVTYSRARVFSGGGVSAVGSGTLHTSPDADGTYAQLHAPAGKTIVDGFVSNANFYDVASDGTMYEGAVSSPGTANSWPLTGGQTPSRIGWGKHRLWVIGGRSIWQPDLSLAAGTNQPPVFTNPNKGWTYTCMAEGTQAMFFGGHDGNASSIQAVTLDTGGAVPTLTGAAVTAVLPEGELVQEIAILAGSLIGIGTNRGFRVGVISSNSTMSYGPLLIEPAGITDCTAITTQGRFFVVAFATADEGAVAYRVDTGNPLSEGVYPYAKDISCAATGSITSLTAVSSSQLVATGSTGSVFYQSPTEYVASGWLQTGRIRFRTTELKDFRYLHLGIEPLNGAIAVDLVKTEGSSLPLGSITRQGVVFDDKFSITAGKQEHVAIKFTLTRDVAMTGSPVINNYLLRAIPAVTPQRLFTLPLMCFDQEQARSGQRYGGSGFARDRLTALQFLEDTAEAVIYQDFTSGADPGGRVVSIESIKYTQTTPASSDGKTGPGGIIVIQLRTVDA